MAENIKATLTTVPAVQASMSNPSYRGSKPIKGIDYWTDADKQELVDLAKGEIAAGLDGKSAYELAIDNGFVGTEEEWLASLKGDTGETGAKGDKGDPGDRGPKGDEGDSALLTVTTTAEGATLVATDKNGTTVAIVKHGEKGDSGAQGPAGQDGHTPVKGEDYFTEDDKTAIKQEVLSEVNVEYLSNSDILDLWNSY